MNLTTLNRIAAFQSGSTRLHQQLEYETSSIVRLQDKVKRIEEEKLDLQKALTLIDKCIELVSAHGIGKIEHIVTAGLQQVLKDDEPISFIVEKKETTRGYNYRLLCKQGETIGNPMTTFGGGVQNMCAFLLRIIMIKRFKLAKVIVLDESFNNVNGAANQSRLSKMLHSLANDFGFTILAITGQKRLAEAATRIYEVSGENGKPVIRLKQYDSISEEGVQDERLNTTQS
jgi:DNA repair exonuclease SbcCD ATPase subunit